MRAKAIAVGTWRWLIEDLELPMVAAQKFMIKPTKNAIVRRLPRPQGSGFLSVRLYKRLVHPLWRRATHVPVEHATPIAQFDKPRTVRLVIQEHDAKRAGKHYDLRIHLDGRAVSFAVPKARLPEIGERLLAVRTPDHIEEYSDFEGRIPDGQMGAGTVRKVFDGHVDLLKSDDVGLHLRVHDEGAGRSRDFVLVRTPRGKHDHWLLTQKRVQPVERILKHNFTLRDAERLDELEATGEYIAEVKMDGSHELIHVTKHGLRLASHRVSKRDGELIEHTDKVPHLRDVKMPGYEGTVMHAEIWHPKGPNFVAGVLNSSVARARHMQQQHGPLKLKVFDMSVVSGESIEADPYDARRLKCMAILAKPENSSPDIHYIRGTKTNFKGFYERVNDGREFRYKNHPSDGVVLKRLDAPYKSAPWHKVKPSDETDLPVVDYTEEMSILGRPKGRLGALIVETPEGKRVNVGSGFSHAQRQWLWDHRDRLAGEVVKVKFHSRNGGPSTTGPRFVGLHNDKSELAGLMENTDG